MIKRLILYIVLGLGVVTVLTFFNYFVAQKRLKEARQTQFVIELLEFPSEVTVGRPSRFVWRVDAPKSFTVSKTGIYYSYDSSPSALLKGDSPEAVGYSNFTPDYNTGPFQLPDTFDLNLSFGKKGVVYIRSYANIDNDHLWSEEKAITVK